MAGVAAAVSTALVAAPSVSPPTPERPASYAVRLSANVESLAAPTDDIPSLLDEIRLGIVPSLGASFPTPPTTGPSPTANDFASAIKDTYAALEPWVHYGVEWAVYIVGWIPYVGWLAPQIDIFYHFGERIVRSLVNNSADWLWGPLPFGEGLGNIARDSWDSVVQLGIDQWHFWLPSIPLPPLPGRSQDTVTLAADLGAASQETSPPTGRALFKSLGERLGVPDLATDDTAAGTPHGVLTHVEQALGRFDTEVKSFGAAVRDSAFDVTTGALPNKVPFSVSSALKVKPTKTPALKAILQPLRKVASEDRKQLRHVPGLSPTPSVKRFALPHRPISPSAQGYHKKIKQDD